MTNPATVIVGSAQQTPATGAADGTNYSIPQPTTAMFSTGPRTPNGSGVYQTHIDVDHPTAGFDYALVQYDVSCAGAPPPPPNKGRINIIKNSIGGDDTFNINISNGGGTVPLTTVGGTAQASRDLNAPATYTLSETAPSGWTLTSISCQIASGGGTASGATVNLAVGTVATCTVTNTRDIATRREL